MYEITLDKLKNILDEINPIYVKIHPSFDNGDYVTEINKNGFKIEIIGRIYNNCFKEKVTVKYYIPNGSKKWVDYKISYFDLISKLEDKIKHIDLEKEIIKNFTYDGKFLV